MFNSLQSRLFLSYLVIIGLTLCVIVGALILLILNNPISTLQTYRRIVDVGRASFPYLASGGPDSLNDRLLEVAQSNDVRILRLSADGGVQLDSAGLIRPGEILVIRPNRDSAPNVGQLQRGTFLDGQGEEWLTVSLSRPNVGSVVFAAPRPRNRIAAALGENLTAPLLEAGAIGVLLSIVFASLISNWISRSLDQTASAVRAIAAGDYGRQAPEKGPAEVRELARNFNRMSRQVEQTRQMQRDFLANVSHELKTPLTSIQGFAQAILDGATTRPAEAAQVIYDEAGRMRRLVEELLDLAKIESGQISFRRETINLSELLQAVIESFRLRASQQQVALSYQGNGLPAVVGDADRLAQVFTNLLDNALNHTPPGGRVTLREGFDQDRVEIAIENTGKGIPPEHLSRIFERFYQADKSRVRSGSKGTGLGLTITKEIVQASGGTLRADSRLGQGATFTVSLPVPHPYDQTTGKRA